MVLLEKALKYILCERVRIEGEIQAKNFIREHFSEQIIIVKVLKNFLRVVK